MLGSGQGVKPGQAVQLGDIKGPGTIRRFWMTTERDPATQRACVVRAYWEGEEYPGIAWLLPNPGTFGQESVRQWRADRFEVSTTARRYL